MRWLFQPLLNLISSSTDTELSRQVEYLRAENEMLRKRLPKRLLPTPDEKGLIVNPGLTVETRIGNGRT